jgi:hypothetical protein
MVPSPRPEDRSQGELDDILRAAARDLRLVPPAPVPGPASGKHADPQSAIPPVVVNPGPPLLVQDPVRLILSDLEPPPGQPQSAVQERGGPPLRLLVLVAGVLGIVSVFGWLWFLSGLTRPQDPAIDTKYLDASAQWSVRIMSQRIEAYWRETGRLPDGLGELGPLGSELIGYERISPVRYRLTAPSPDGPLTFDSTHPEADMHGKGGSDPGTTAGARP